MSIEGSLTRRQVFIQRFASGEAVKAQRLLASVYDEVVKRLAGEPDVIAGAKLRRLQEDIANLLGIQLGELGDKILEDAVEFAQDEAAFATRALNAGVTVQLANVDLDAVSNMVTGRGMDTPIGPAKLTLKEAIDTFSKNKRREVLQVINEGILIGDNNSQLINKIKKLSTGRPRHQIEALVRTAVNHSSTMARRAATDENIAIFEAEEWVTVLDSRTTLICGGRSGNLYPIGQGPYPPAHWNCRSLRVPIVKPEFAVDEKDTRVTEDKDFDKWLRGQDAEFQDEYFSQFANGKEKAALFRRGGLAVDKFRTETGANYTLDDLRRIEPLAFRKANIE